MHLTLCHFTTCSVLATVSFGYFLSFSTRNSYFRLNVLRLYVSFECGCERFRSSRNHYCIGWCKTVRALYSIMLFFGSKLSGSCHVSAKSKPISIAPCVLGIGRPSKVTWPRWVHWRVYRSNSWRAYFGANIIAGGAKTWYVCKDQFHCIINTNSEATTSVVYGTLEA